MFMKEIQGDNMKVTEVLQGRVQLQLGNGGPTNARVEHDGGAGGQCEL